MSAVIAKDRSDTITLQVKREAWELLRDTLETDARAKNFDIELRNAITEALETVREIPSSYYVMCSGGLVQDIVADDLTNVHAEPGKTVEIETVDFDNAESGECPVCRENTILDADGNDQCPECGWDENMEYADVIACAKGERIPIDKLPELPDESEPWPGDYVQMLDAQGDPCENHTRVNRWVGWHQNHDTYLIEDDSGERYYVQRCPDLDTDQRRAWREVKFPQ